MRKDLVYFTRMDADYTNSLTLKCSEGAEATRLRDITTFQCLNFVRAFHHVLISTGLAEPRYIKALFCVHLELGSEFFVSYFNTDFMIKFHRC
jgi:hypothetical protein